MGREKGSKNRPKDIPNIDDIDLSSDNSNIEKVYMTKEQYEGTIEKFTSINRELADLFDNTNSAYYDPIMGQRMLEQINGKVKRPTRDELNLYLNNPMGYKSGLKQVSRYLEAYIMQYKRTLNYIARILTYKYELVNHDIVEDIVKDKNEWESFIKSRNKVWKELEKFNIKDTFTMVTDRVLEDGIVFYIKTNNGKFISLFEVPEEYCKVTGKYDLGYTWSIDLAYFDRYLGIEDCVPELVHAYKTFINMRDLGAKGDLLAQYQYHSVQPNEGWCFAYDMSKFDATPPLKGAFKDAIEISEYKNLLHQRIVLDCTMVLAQKVEYDKEHEKFVMDYKEWAKIASITQRTLPNGVRTFVSPFDTNLHNLSNTQANNNIKNVGKDNYFDSVGVSQTLLGGDAKSAGVLDFAVKSDSGFIDHMYRQYENYINYHLMILSTKFNWKIKMFGNRYTDDDDMKEYASKVQSLNQPLSKLIAYLGYTEQEYYNIVEYEKKVGIKDKLMPILSGNVMSGKTTDKESGRPKTEDIQLTESGENSKIYDSNINKG